MIYFSQMRICLFLFFLFTTHLLSAADGFCPDSILISISEEYHYYFEIDGLEEGAVVTWDFGDESATEVGSVMYHTYEMGIYVVTASFEDQDCPDNVPSVLTIEITVDECFLTLSYVEVKPGFYTITASGYPEKYPMYWDMGDGTTIVETWVVDHIYDPGAYQVCAYITSKFCADTLSACTEIVFDPTQIAEPTTDSELAMVFPNPASTSLRLDFHESVLDWVILNSLGECVYCGNPLKFRYDCDVGTLESGCYFLQLRTATHIETKKIMILHP